MLRDAPLLELTHQMYLPRPAPTTPRCARGILLALSDPLLVRLPAGLPVALGLSLAI